MITSKKDTPLHFAQFNVLGKANQTCKSDKCKAKEYLLKDGQCRACPTDYVTDPKNKSNCVHGKQVKTIMCKRGHRVDQLEVENYLGEKQKSHNGFAGGGWRRNDQIVRLPTDEYVRRVDGYHITKGGAKQQLAKVVYFTSKNRIISCYYNRVRYAVERKSFSAEKGKYIQGIKQFQDKRKCCGRITEVVTADHAKSMTYALHADKLKTCKENEFLEVKQESYSCKACTGALKRDPDNMYKCALKCTDYQYLNNKGDKCIVDTCNKYEMLGKDGKCEECKEYKATPDPAPAAPALKKIGLKNARMSSTWCCKYRSEMLEAKNALTANVKSFAHTRMGRGHWWYAQFADGNRQVTEVKITNRQDCCGDRLKGTKVYVGRYLCGVLPALTKTKETYTVKCAKPVTGNSIIIR